MGLVAPIMMERGFRVRSLREFLPRGTRLLGRNWNRGDVIEVRLRVSRSDKLTYLPVSEIVGTMLHELVHNVYGHHRQAFKKLLADITRECEERMMMKVILPSIVACGDILGGDLEAMDTYSQRDLARFAAESRLVLSLSINKSEETFDPECIIVIE